MHDLFFTMNKRFFVVAGLLWGLTGFARADLVATVAKLKPAVVIVGSFKTTANPRFSLRGTGFVLAELGTDKGNWVVTNAHVLPGPAEEDVDAQTVVQVRSGSGPNELQMRKAVVVEVDVLHDLALLRIEGAAITGFALGDSDRAREGQAVAFMGFPIGGALGFSTVTHRGTISSITAAALPSASAGQLNAKSILSLRSGSFDIFQLDGTAYPGNSGGPLFDPESGEVLGVVNMVFVKGTKESALTHPSGISYAIPAKFITQLMARTKTN